MTNPEWPRAVIFDLDGLLVDSERIWLLVETMLLEARGYRYDPRVRDRLVGLRMDEFIDGLRGFYPMTEPTAALCDESNRYFIDLLPTHVAAQPGAHELIACITERGLPRAVASSAPMVVIDAVLEQQGWAHTFPVRCSADDDANGKPAPDVYLRAAARLQQEPAACLALEDSPNGARAAVAAGMTCYAVPDPSHSRPEAFAGITEHIFASLHGVREALMRGAP